MVGGVDRPPVNGKGAEVSIEPRDVPRSAGERLWSVTTLNASGPRPTQLVLPRKVSDHEVRRQVEVDVCGLPLLTLPGLVCGPWDSLRDEGLGIKWV